MQVFDGLVGMHIVFDTGKEGLETVLRDWQVEAMRTLWKLAPNEASSGEVYNGLKEVLKEKGEPTSKHSVEKFLHRMASEGILNEGRKSGKEGIRRVYTPRMNKYEFTVSIAKEIISEISDMWPDAAREALRTSMAHGD